MSGHITAISQNNGGEQHRHPQHERESLERRKKKALARSPLVSCARDVFVPSEGPQNIAITYTQDPKLRRQATRTLVSSKLPIQP